MMNPPNARALMISAARSGSGKTVVAIALQRAFSRRGLRVAGAKVGPDYLDPGFHAAACGRPAFNLDGFAMEGPVLGGLAARIGADVELVLAEGAMGLFDGPANAGRGSSAQTAAALGWPVLLVLEADGAAQTLAATALGLSRFPGAPSIAGVIVNRAASTRHGRMIADGFACVGIPLLGMVPRDERLRLPSRHLGLVQACEIATLGSALDAMADVIEAACDLDALAALAAPIRAAPPPALPRPPGQRIAVARDEAFGFLYPHLLDGWRRAGAEIAFFSPLADEPPPDECDLCWLPGGYPELHAGRLATATGFRDGLRRFAETRSVHGECGGYMALGRTLEDAEGVVHPMADLLPIDTSFRLRKLHLGYRRATWRSDMPFAPAGSTSIGHEYHHATLVSSDGEVLADMVNGEGELLPSAGTRNGRVTGGFFHLIA
jgi:cobyrinic acid a,c-diamide synthase